MKRSWRSVKLLVALGMALALSSLCVLQQAVVASDNLHVSRNPPSPVSELVENIAKGLKDAVDNGQNLNLTTACLEWAPGRYIAFGRHSRADFVVFSPALSADEIASLHLADELAQTLEFQWSAVEDYATGLVLGTWKYGGASWQQAASFIVAAWDKATLPTPATDDWAHLLSAAFFLPGGVTNLNPLPEVKFAYAMPTDGTLVYSSPRGFVWVSSELQLQVALGLAWGDESRSVWLTDWNTGRVERLDAEYVSILDQFAGAIPEGSVIKLRGLWNDNQEAISELIRIVFPPRTTVDWPQGQPGPGVQWPEWASTSYRGDTSLTFFQGAEDLQVFVDWLLHQVPISEASERLYGWVGLDQATQRTGY